MKNHTKHAALKTPRNPNAIHQFRFLPVSPRDKDWGLYVIAAGYGSIPPHSSYPLPHGPSLDWGWQGGRVLQDYAVVYIVRGEGEFESEGATARKIEPGSLILLFPGVRHRYRPTRKTGWDEYWVVFGGEHADRWRERGFLRPEEPVVRIGGNVLLLRAFTTLLDRVRDPSRASQQLLAASVTEIVTDIIDTVHRQRIGDHLNELVGQIKLALSDSLANQATIDELADGLDVSRSYVFQIFKMITGLSPYQYRLQVQLGRAKDLLLNSSLSIKQIAHSVKFNSVHQFSKTFRNKVGMTPGEYRHGGPCEKRAGRPPRDHT